MRRLASTPDVLAPGAGATLDDCGQLGQAGLEQVVLDAQRPHPIDERGVRHPDRRQVEAPLRLLGRRADALDELSGDLVGGQLVELVDDPDRLGDVGDAQAAVEALDQLPVVELEGDRRDRQRRERLDHDPHDLHVVVEGELALSHDVDVGLGELPVAALLRSFAAPGRLDLEPAERELEVAGVLQHVAGERDREVEVHAETGVVRGVLGLEPAQHVDLLVDLTALGQPVERLDDPGLDVGEAVQLEGAGQRVDDGALHRALGRQQLGEPADRGGLGHRSETPRDATSGSSVSSVCRSSRKGLVARSRPMEVCSP